MDVVFYRDRRGHEQVVEHLRAARRASDRSAARLRRLVELQASSGAPLGMPHDRLIDEAERIFELRFGPHRVAHIVNMGIVDAGVVDAGRAVLLNASRKRSQALDRLDLERARARANDWRGRS